MAPGTPRAAPRSYLAAIALGLAVVGGHELIVQPLRLEVAVLADADIHHVPWPLQPAAGEFEVNTMTAPYAIDLPDEQPLLHFAARQDVVIWPLRLD